MDGVISIVEAQIVKHLASKVARKIESRAHVATIMLEEIQREDAVFRVELRQQRKPEPATPVQEYENCGAGPDSNLLESALPYDRSVETSLSCKI